MGPPFLFAYRTRHLASPVSVDRLMVILSPAHCHTALARAILPLGLGQGPLMTRRLSGTSLGRCKSIVTRVATPSKAFDHERPTATGILDWDPRGGHRRCCAIAPGPVAIRRRDDAGLSA